MRICAVTVLYNPGNFVPDHIQTYLDHVDELFIIDNSEIRNSEIEDAIKNRFSNNKVRLIYNNGNIGIAGALNRGFQLAEQGGFNWVLTMDQDSYFDNTDFFKISTSLLTREDIGIIAASYRKENPFRKPFSDDYYKYLIVITSANLVNISAWKKVGGFNDKLFIDEVDNDFCIRLALQKFIVLGSKNILLKHGLGEAFSIQPPFLKKSIPLGIHSPLRVRYTIRNRLFVIKKYLFSHPGFALNRLGHSTLLFAFIIFSYPQKSKYLSAFFRGITDFLFSGYGKIEWDDKSKKP